MDYECIVCGVFTNNLYKIRNKEDKKVIEVCVSCVHNIRDKNLNLEGKAKQNIRSPISEKDKEIIFSKFNNECAICSIKEGLHIHHKDQNPSNNIMANLILLCGVCHKKIHMKVR